MDQLKTIPSEATELRAGSQTLSVESETFSLTPYSGQLVEHWYWGQFVFETSSMKMYKDKIPALVDHDTTRGCGVIDEMSIEGNEAVFSGKFVENQNSQYVKDMKEVGMECSLRFDPEKTRIEEVPEGAEVEVNGETFTGPLFVFRDTTIMEVSFTLFGHVPNTETSFVHSSNNQGEETMADTAPTQAELEQSAQNTVTERLSRMNEMCDDASFVMECFNKGMSIEDFGSELLSKQSEELASLKGKVSDLEAQLEEAKSTDGVAFSAGESADKEDEPKDFMGKASKLAKDEGIKLHVALSKVAKENPDLYEQFKSEAPVAPKKVGGAK